MVAQRSVSYSLHGTVRDRLNCFLVYRVRDELALSYVGLFSFGRTLWFDVVSGKKCEKNGDEKQCCNVRATGVMT